MNPNDEILQLNSWWTIVNGPTRSQAVLRYLADIKEPCSPFTTSSTPFPSLKRHVIWHTVLKWPNIWLFSSMVIPSSPYIYEIIHMYFILFANLNMYIYIWIRTYILLIDTNITYEISPFDDISFLETPPLPLPQKKTQVLDPGILPSRPRWLGILRLRSWDRSWYNVLWWMRMDAKKVGFL